MKCLRIAGVVLALSTGLGACGASGNPQPTVTVTAEATAQNGLTEREFTETLRRLWMNDYSESQRTNMCEAVKIDPQAMFDSFMNSGSNSGDPVMRGWLTEFFANECSTKS